MEALKRFGTVHIPPLGTLALVKVSEQRKRHDFKTGSLVKQSPFTRVSFRASVTLKAFLKGRSKKS